MIAKKGSRKLAGDGFKLTRFDALMHGLAGKIAVRPGEDPEDF